eukprot:Skav221906  [mRNA]  locus=scaffold1640:3840:8376:+ [translate_table: standard]
MVSASSAAKRQLLQVDVLIVAPIMGNENAAMMRVVRTLKSLRALRLLRTFRDLAAGFVRGLRLLVKACGLALQESWWVIPMDNPLAHLDMVISNSEGADSSQLLRSPAGGWGSNVEAMDGQRGDATWHGLCAPMLRKAKGQPCGLNVLLAVFMSIGALVLGNLLLDFSNSEQENLEATAANGDPRIQGDNDLVRARTDPTNAISMSAPPNFQPMRPWAHWKGSNQHSGQLQAVMPLAFVEEEPVLPVMPADIQYLDLERAGNAAFPTDWPKLAGPMRACSKASAEAVAPPFHPGPRLVLAMLTPIVVICWT